MAMKDWDPAIACCDFHAATGFEPQCAACQDVAFFFFPPDFENTEAQLDKASDMSFEFPES